MYAVIIDLQTPGKLTLEDFDRCIESIIATQKRSFPNSAYTERVRFKWIGYQDKLVIFNYGYDHWNVRDLLAKGEFVHAPIEGGGHIELVPPKRHFWGFSQTLEEDGLSREQSNKYKLEMLPKLLGIESLSFE